MTTSSDLAYRSLAEAAALVRSRSVSPVELVQAMLDRIERLDSELRAFITVTAERALDEARRAEVAAGEDLSPLHGVPIALKDLFDTAGVHTTSGSDLLRDRVPKTDAFVVSRLRAAGAISLGKLNMHEFAYGVTTANPHYGVCRNPWDTGRIPGGSSGGSGAAVAASLCYGALGSDTGGSIRIPASLCGIVGLKPTYGRVSRSGVLPLSWSLDHVGPMTRTVTDAALMLTAIAGHDPADPGSAPVPAHNYLGELESGVRGLRIGVPRAHYSEGLAPAVERAVRDALDVLRSEGAEVRAVDIPDIELAALAFSPIISAEATAYHQRWLRESPERYDPGVRERLTLGEFYSGPQYVNAQRLRGRVIAGFASALSEVDLLVTAATPITAPLVTDVSPGTPNPSTVFTYPTDVSGSPSLSLPCGFDESDLPIGLQIIGRNFDEATVLRAGRAYERATEWHRRRPAL